MLSLSMGIPLVHVVKQAQTFKEGPESVLMHMVCALHLQ